MGKLLMVCLLAYLAGSVNFAIIFFKIAGKADPRLGFSGNAGTTNVYRQAGRLWAALIFALDIGRALAVAALALYFLDRAWLAWPGFFLILGNTFPCFHGFRGGKGVANYLGFTLLVAPWAALAACTLWVMVYAVVRRPFVASFFMAAALAAGQAQPLDVSWPALSGALTAFILIVFNHRENIRQYRRERNSTSCP
ncbi:MAG: glycerol-3-phosphate acyltransferase [Deltaproteobacteria bacterium]|nr:glycerol-3-phosphate acyltransferase [Deltaproteobacteria bacterium]